MADPTKEQIEECRGMKQVDMAKKLGIGLRTLQKLIQKYGSDVSLSRGRPQPDHYGTEIYKRKVEVKCYNGCPGVFSKVVSMDVINKLVRMPRFLCSSCQGRNIETVYTYPGQ